MIRLVGMGPGNPDLLTKQALEAVTQAQTAVAFGRLTKTALQLRPDCRQMGRVKQLIPAIEKVGSEDLVILASGDVCFYGVLDHLQKNGVEIDEVIPGISSFQYLMAKLKKSWSTARLFSLHGRETNWEGLREASMNILLTDKDQHPNFISHKAYEMGLRGKLTAGFDLSYPEEVILTAAIGQEIELPSPLAVVVLEHEMA